MVGRQHNQRKKRGDTNMYIFFICFSIDFLFWSEFDAGDICISFYGFSREWGWCWGMRVKVCCELGGFTVLSVAS